MRKTFYDGDFMEWEAYVSGGEMDGQAAARIYFLCLTAPSRRARFVTHDSGNPAEAQRELISMDDEELLDLLRDAEPLS